MRPIMLKVEMIDHDKTGLLVRNKRKELKLALSVVAGRTELSCSYLSELERGDRNWTEDLFQKVWGALR